MTYCLRFWLKEIDSSFLDCLSSEGFSDFGVTVFDLISMSSIFSLRKELTSFFGVDLRISSNRAISIFRCSSFLDFLPVVRFSEFLSNFSAVTEPDSSVFLAVP